MPTIAKCRFVLVPVCLLLCALVSLWSASPRPLALRPPRRCDSALQPWEWRDEEEPGDEFAPDARSRTRWQVEAESDERGGELLAGAQIVDNSAPARSKTTAGPASRPTPSRSSGWIFVSSVGPVAPIRSRCCCHGPRQRGVRLSHAGGVVTSSWTSSCQPSSSTSSQSSWPLCDLLDQTGGSTDAVLASHFAPHRRLRAAPSIGRRMPSS